MDAKKELNDEVKTKETMHKIFAKPQFIITRQVKFWSVIAVKSSTLEHNK